MEEVGILGDAGECQPRGGLRVKQNRKVSNSKWKKPDRKPAKSPCNYTRVMLGSWRFRDPGGLQRSLLTEGVLATKCSCAGVSIYM